MPRCISILLATPLLLLLAAAPATLPAPATQPAPAILARAHRILATMKDTVYQHTTDIDESAGEYHCDCSGLVGWILKKELPQHYKAVEFPAKFRRPRACEFEDAFAAAPTSPQPGKLWMKIETVADARPGDLIAWKKDPMPATGSTGHIVIVDAAPWKVADDIYAVTIIDSTTGPHDNDTRKADETGVGRGTIFIKVDSAGRPISRAGKSSKGPFIAFPMSIGRAVGGK